MSNIMRVSLHGKKMGMSPENNLVSEGVQITQPCVDATITVGDENTNVRIVTIQLLDSNGDDIAYAETVELIMYLDAAQVAFVATGGSTGIEIGTDGALLDIVAKKYFMATSEVDGDIDVTWTDTGTEVAFIGLRLPNGRIIMSDTLANAA